MLNEHKHGSLTLEKFAAQKGNYDRRVKRIFRLMSSLAEGIVLFCPVTPSQDAILPCLLLPKDLSEN